MTLHEMQLPCNSWQVRRVEEAIQGRDGPVNEQQSTKGNEMQVV